MICQQIETQSLLSLGCLDLYLILHLYFFDSLIPQPHKLRPRNQLSLSYSNPRIVKRTVSLLLDLLIQLPELPLEMFTTNHLHILSFQSLKDLAEPFEFLVIFAGIELKRTLEDATIVQCSHVENSIAFDTLQRRVEILLAG